MDLTQLRSLCAYRNLLHEPVAAELVALSEAMAQGRGEAALEAYARVFYGLRQAGFAALGDYFDHLLRYSDAPYPLALERGEADAALEAAAARDIEILAALAQSPCKDLLQAIAALPGGEGAAALPCWQERVPFTFEALKEFYLTHGCGLFARYRAFLWDGRSLRGIPDPDCPREEELIGYDAQRQKVIANTRALLEGQAVNNVLLYGESGSGKSATVKSLLTRPEFSALRLIEVRKDALGTLDELLHLLSSRRQKFILFIDDLSFDQDDKTYSALKTILEGGLARRSANVAVYATSNRRHLVRQTFSARAGDEVDREETIAEKTSLSDRFGLRVPFLALDKPGFLALVEALAAQAGLEVPPETLRAGAIAFEARHPGRTPRTAQQYIASLRV